METLPSGLMSIMRSQYAMISTSQTLRTSCCWLWWVEKHQNPLKNLSSTKKNNWKGHRSIIIDQGQKFSSLLKRITIHWDFFFGKSSRYDIMCITKFFCSQSWASTDKWNLSLDSLKDIKKLKQDSIKKISHQETINSFQINLTAPLRIINYLVLVWFPNHI